MGGLSVDVKQGTVPICSRYIHKVANVPVFQTGWSEIKALHTEIKVLGNMAQGQWASLTTAFRRNVTRESLLLFFTAIFYVGNQVEISQVFLQYFRPGISWKLARFLLRAANQTKRLTASPWRRLSDSS